MKKNGVTAYLVTKLTHLTFLLGLTDLNPHYREYYLLITPSNYYLFHSALVIPPAHLQGLVKSVTLSYEKPLVSGLRKLIKQKSFMADLDDLSVSQFRQLQTKIPCRIKPAPPLIDGLRQIKDAYEISAITKACRTTARIMADTIGSLKPGETESSVSRRIFLACLSADTLITQEFLPIVASGPNSAIPHHVPGKRAIKPNDVVLIDFGCQVEGYWSDMTRTVKLGSQGPAFTRIETAVKTAYHQAGQAIQTTHDPSAADQAVSDSLKKMKLDHLMPHTTGHGLGLAVHEPPSLSRLKPGQKITDGSVFTIEPGLYLPGRFGYRFENTLLLQNGRIKTLTKSKAPIPKSIRTPR